MYATRLPRLRHRRTPYQVQKRKKKIAERRSYATLTTGVRKEKTSILWPWQQVVRERLKRGRGSAGGTHVEK